MLIEHCICILKKFKVVSILFGVSIKPMYPVRWPVAGSLQINLLDIAIKYTCKIWQDNNYFSIINMYIDATRHLGDYPAATERPLSLQPIILIYLAEAI